MDTNTQASEAAKRVVLTWLAEPDIIKRSSMMQNVKNKYFDIYCRAKRIMDGMCGANK